MSNNKYKIAINISPLNNGNNIRGVGYYTKNLVEALQQEIKSNSEYKNFQIDLIENIKLKNKNYDLVHYPYFDPFFLTLPFPQKIPQIVSIHDLIPLEFKSHFPVGIKGWIKWQIQKFIAKQSNYIITISHHSKYIITDLLNYPTDQIYVTYLAADENYHPNYSSTYLSAIKRKYNLPDKFVLNNGDIDWHKNIPALVNTCQKLKYPLVIVGGAATKKNVPIHPWTKDLRWLQSIASNQTHAQDLTLTGFVPDEDLPGIYKLATIYCQPSFAEGFGLGVVKAMQVGTPVVYSQESSLPEVMDFSGEHFNPYDQDGLKKALQKVWTNKKYQQQLSQLGIKRARYFSWDKTAKQTLAVYKLALMNEK